MIDQKDFTGALRGLSRPAADDAIAAKALDLSGYLDGPDEFTSQAW